MLFQMIKAALIIAFLMIGWVSLQYIVRRKKNLSVDCDLLEDKRGCMGCSDDSCSHKTT
jgi:hypothetical protein